MCCGCSTDAHSFPFFYVQNAARAMSLETPGHQHQEPTPSSSSAPLCKLDMVDTELKHPRRGALQGQLGRLQLGGGPREENEKCKGVKNKYTCLSGVMEGPRLEAGEAGSALG